MYSYIANGPLRGIVAISSGKGEVRGYVGSPMLGDMHLSEAVGKGMVQVVKNHPDWPNPYNGITQIRHGDVDRDIGTYCLTIVAQFLWLKLKTHAYQFSCFANTPVHQQNRYLFSRK